jgi:hypothetical protein
MPLRDPLREKSFSVFATTDPERVRRNRASYERVSIVLLATVQCSVTRFTRVATCISVLRVHVAATPVVNIRLYGVRVCGAVRLCRDCGCVCVRACLWRGTAVP